jgi:beta-lactamase superfamily II metal-dependent hydrolase
MAIERKVGAAKRPKSAQSTKNAAAKKGAPRSSPKELRVRMYRVGFGDFFLLTLPSGHEPQHVLIDCGVTTGRTGKGDIHTIKAAVAHMADVTDHTLALIIVTHRHKDHIIGFSRCAAEFKKFKVGAIWMPFWETEYDPNVSKFQADLNALALDVQQHIAVAGAKDPATDEILGMLENATGVSLTEGPGGGSNPESLNLLKTEMGVKPQYYHKGQKPKLPPALAAAGLGAEILGPPPLDATAFMKLMDLKKGVGQYLDANAPEGREAKRFAPFAPEWQAKATEYPCSAFREWAPRTAGVVPDFSRRYPQPLEEAIHNAQPAVLFTAAKQLDAFLNNQSLVVLFTWNGKKLLFAGDAQAGNWEYWLYDLDKPSKTTQGEKLTAEGASILGSLDFYKVGHHGSTNATPISAVQAMGKDFTAMCSTQADSFGKVENQSEVPRVPLLEALTKKCALVRSDQIAVKLDGQSVPAVAEAPKKLPTPKRGRFEVGPCYVDYLL